jgi:ABC-type uncharacterized transport system substrate-binding protein
MITRLKLAVGVTLLLGASVAAEAQQSGKTARIGHLSLAAGPNPNMDVFRGLRELGWIEGRNLNVVYRWAAGNEHQLPAMAAELVGLNVDVIVTSTTAAALAAKRATTKIPIVITFVADPVGSGIVSNLARPGGNITGLSTLAGGLVAKRLELLKIVAPQATRVGVLWQPAILGEGLTRGMLDEAQTAGRALGLRLQPIEVRRGDDIQPAFASLREGRAAALLVFPGPLLFEERRSIIEQAARNALPAVYPWREAADAGGLMSYATNFPEMYRRAAVYVDKILKGAKPADLPIEQPTRLELVINLKTAKALKLTLPESLLQRADQVIR